MATTYDVMHLRRGVSALAALLVALCLSSSSAQAQEARQITFNEAVRIALDQNVLLRQQRNQVDLGAIGVARNRSEFLPRVDFSSNGRQSYGRTFSQEDLGFVNQTTESFSAGASASVNVFNGFRDVRTLQQSRLALNAEELSLDRSRQQVVFTVMTTFLDLVERGEQIRVLEDDVEAQQQQLDQITELVRVGSRPISDQYQQEASVAQAELLVLQQQRLYQIAEANLIQILQLDPLAAYAFVAPDLDDASLEDESYALMSMTERAFQQRPDLQAAEYDIAAAREGVTVARSGYWPSVDLSFGYGTGWNSQFFDPTQDNVSFFEQLQQQRGGSLSLSLSVPIFDRFTTRYNTQQAQVQFDNARLQLDALRQDVALQVRQAYLDYLSAEKELDVTAKQVRAAERALEAAQERYNVGASTLIELTQARAAATRAAGDQVSARYDFIFQKRLIDYYIGVLDPTQPLFE